MSKQYKYRVVSMWYPSFNSSMDGVSLDIFFAGCTRHCPGCHNEELQEFSEADVTTQEILDTIATAPKAEVVSIMGGEPLEQDHLVELIDEIKQRFNVKVAVFTGMEPHEVPLNLRDKVDYLKTGMYLQDKRTPTGSFLASTNQVLWKKVGDTWKKQWSYDINSKTKGER